MGKEFPESLRLWLVGVVVFRFGELADEGGFQVDVLIGKIAWYVE